MEWVTITYSNWFITPQTPFWLQFFLSFYLLTLFHVYLFPYYSFNKPRRILPQGLCIHHGYSCKVILSRTCSNVISTSCSTPIQAYSLALISLKHNSYPCHTMHPTQIGTYAYAHMHTHFAVDNKVFLTQKQVSWNQEFCFLTWYIFSMCYLLNTFFH